MVGVLEAVTTIFVADPRQAFQEHIERAVEDYGFATSGVPDLVLTPDSTTAKFWSRKNVPVLLYDFGDTIDITGLMVIVFAVLEQE